MDIFGFNKKVTFLIYILLDTMFVGIGMGVPIFPILLGFPVGWYITRRLTLSERDLPDILPDILKYNGKEYKLHDKGNASGKLTSRVGDQFYQCRYYDYKNGNEILSIEDFKADIEVSIGVELIKSQIEILPGG